jgi:hypothetical protein
MFMRVRTGLRLAGGTDVELSARRDLLLLPIPYLIHTFSTGGRLGSLGAARGGKESLQPILRGEPPGEPSGEPSSRSLN